MSNYWYEEFNHFSLDFFMTMRQLHHFPVLAYAPMEESQFERVLTYSDLPFSQRLNFCLQFSYFVYLNNLQNKEPNRGDSQVFGQRRC